MKKIFGFLTAVLFTFGLGMTSAHALPLKGLSGKESPGPAYRGYNQEGTVLILAKTTSEEKIEKYEKKAQETINEYKEKLRDLELKAKNMSEKAKAEAKESMQELKKKIDVAEQKIKSIRSASGEAWEKLKAEVDASLESVKDAYKEVVARFG